MVSVSFRFWKHLAAGILLAVTAEIWALQYNVWTSIKLDLFGIPAYGNSTPVPGREIAEYECEFTTSKGEVIRGRVYGGYEPNIFLYLPENPHIFKPKGSGHGVQGFVVVLFLLALWQFIIALVSLSHRRKT